MFEEKIQHLRTVLNIGQEKLYLQWLSVTNMLL